MGSFVFKWPRSDATEVYVTGTFDNWAKTEKLEKSGDIFEKEVNIPDASQKIYYKFFVDGQWTTDSQAPQEDDGHSNVNNILKPEDIKKQGSSLGAGTIAGVAGGAAAAVGGLGAALLSGVRPDSTTTKLAGDVPKETGNESLGDADLPSDATSLAQKPSPPGGFPETPAQEPDSFSVKPIPASEGAGNPVSLSPGEKLPTQEDTLGSAVNSKVTTSKEDYEKAANPTIPEESQVGVQPIPASAGIGNPVSVPAGESVKDYTKAGPGAIDATATTSKEDYEKAGGTAMPVGAAVDSGSDPNSSMFSVPDRTKDMIPESSLPMSGEAKDATYAGPFIQSSGPGTTTAAMAGQVPLEKKTEPTVPYDESPSATVAGPAPDVPEVVQESMARSREPLAEAQDKREVEQEPLRDVETTQATGESAPVAATATSATAPAASAPPSSPPDITSEAETKTDTIENPKQDSTKTTAPTGPTAIPSSSVASPPPAADNNTATKDKKNRRSFFGKLKEKLKG